MFETVDDDDYLARSIDLFIHLPCAYAGTFFACQGSYCSSLLFRHPLIWLANLCLQHKVDDSVALAG